MPEIRGSVFLIPCQLKGLDISIVHVGVHAKSDDTTLGHYDNELTTIEPDRSRLVHFLLRSNYLDVLVFRPVRYRTIESLSEA